jgi:hypothetical protein
MVMTNKAKEFYEAIESLVWKHDIEYMDAIIMHCEKNNIEVESVASLIKSNENIKSKIQFEAEKLHFLPKTARLDI